MPTSALLREDLADYLAILDDPDGKLTAATMAIAMEIPSFQAIIETVDPEEQEQSRLLRRAAFLDGQWDAWYANLRAQGAKYAKGGIPMADWFRLLAGFRPAARHEILEAYGDDLMRAYRILDAMSVTSDVAIQEIAEGYLDALEAQRHRVEVERNAAQRQVERTIRDLEQRNRELDDFAYVASHDLLSPLRDIDNLATWIVEDVGDALPEPSRVHLDKLRGRVRRMEALLRDLLVYSRAARQSERSEAFSSDAAIREAVEQAAVPDAFEVTVQGELPDLVGARTALQTIVRNYVANAFKHHDRGHGRIDVTGRVEGTHLVVEVADDGPGIPPEHHERVFEVFQSLAPHNGSGDSTGLGLALVRKLCQAYDGRCGVRSADRGTTAWVAWPLRWPTEEG